MSTGYRLVLLMFGGALWLGGNLQAGLPFVDRFAPFYTFLWAILWSLALVPQRRWLVGIIVGGATVALLTVANEVKVSATSLPVTLFDVWRFLLDPVTVLYAIGLGSRETYFSGALLLLCTVGLIGFTSIRAMRNARWTRHCAISCLVAASVGVGILGMGIHALANYGRFVHQSLPTTRVKLLRDLWRPETQVQLLHQLGSIGYLAFSATVPNNAVYDNSNTIQPLPPPPSAADVYAAAAKFVHLRAKASKPNIVVIQAESTFDPNYTFNLTSYFSLPLWSKLEQTRVLGPLRVNIIGGGSFVSEYEAMVGADSRTFGYRGYYTHYALAPLTKDALPIYLAARGYATRAFYATQGAFYNARAAYRHYGFAEFVEGAQLYPPEMYRLCIKWTWSVCSDASFVEKVAEAGYFAEVGPYFYFLVTTENHGPHPCIHYKKEADLDVFFQADANFAQNCSLNEYLRRAKSTASAFTTTLQHLIENERVTGRPFVLVIYGDHQPWSFTEGIYTIPGGAAREEGHIESFARFRREGGQTHTFFHIVSSAEGQSVIKEGFSVPPPVTLLPTLISAFVATSPDDLYLPINFYALAICGSDSKSSECPQAPYIATAVKEAVLREPVQK
jgi:hypothetical protein